MTARRCLFGRPTPEQQAAVRAKLDAALARIRLEQMEKWGFDFENGIPLPDSEYVYELIPMASVPEFYRPRNVSASTSKPLEVSTSSSVTMLSPLSSPSTSDHDDSILPESGNSSFEEEEVSSNKFKFTEPPTPRKSPMKRQQKMTDYMSVSRKKNSLSPKCSPVHALFTPKKSPPTNVIYTPKARRQLNHRSPY